MSLKQRCVNRGELKQPLREGALIYIFTIVQVEKRTRDVSQIRETRRYHRSVYGSTSTLLRTK